MRYSKVQVRQTLNDFKKSNLSKKDFCKQRNLPLTTFAYWMRKLAKREHSIQQPSGFVAVQPDLPVKAKEHQVITITYANGTSIQLSAQVEVSFIKALVQ
jgi:predicted acetyltransferase